MGRRSTWRPPMSRTADLHSALDALVRAHRAEGYAVAVDMLTRTSRTDDIAPDVSVYPAARDPRTGGRQLEEPRVRDRQHPVARAGRRQGGQARRPRRPSRLRRRCRARAGAGVGPERQPVGHPRSARPYRGPGARGAHAGRGADRRRAGRRRDRASPADQAAPRVRRRARGGRPRWVCSRAAASALTEAELRAIRN